ncbi:hypothetical protein D3C85_959610 [compost metagenome]
MISSRGNSVSLRPEASISKPPLVMSHDAANIPGSPHTDEPISCASDLPLELSPTR